MQHVSLAVTINTGTSNLPLILEKMERTLRLLTKSTGLKSFSVEVRSVYYHARYHSPVHARLRLLRLEVGTLIFPETRSLIEVELDFAWAVLGFFRSDDLRRAEDELLRGLR